MFRPIALILLILGSPAGELKPLPDMTSARLATPRDAEKTVLQHILTQTKEGLLATQSVTAKVAILLGHNLDDFGRAGERVWQVHIVELGGGTQRIFWVNAETGKIRILYEQKQ